MREPRALTQIPAAVGGKPLVVVEAPSNLGLMPPAPGREPGVRRLPEALALAGLPARLPSLWGGRIEPPSYRGDIDPASGIRHAPEVAQYASALARAVGAALELGFPLVLGGDCSILLGCLLALRRRGRAGLVSLDGHDDFSLPESSASRGAAAMELALATGRGPAVLADLEGRGPLVRDEDVLAVGAREKTPSLPFRSLDVRELRARGAALAIPEAIPPIPAEGFWVHLDVDVLDPGVMPAVDSPEPDGLSLPELSDVLRVLLASGRSAGMDVTILDPDRDPDGSSARLLVRLLGGVFGSGTESRR
jgi:arginase